MNDVTSNSCFWRYCTATMSRRPPSKKPPREGKNVCSSTKIPSASGGLTISFRGLCPLDPRWGQSPQTPVIGLRSRAHHTAG